MFFLKKLFCSKSMLHILFNLTDFYCTRYLYEKCNKAIKFKLVKKVKPRHNIPMKSNKMLFYGQSLQPRGPFTTKNFITTNKFNYSQH